MKGMYVQYGEGYATKGLVLAEFVALDSTMLHVLNIGNSNIDTVDAINAKPSYPFAPPLCDTKLYVMPKEFFSQRNIVCLKDVLCQRVPGQYAFVEPSGSIRHTPPYMYKYNGVYYIVYINATDTNNQITTIIVIANTEDNLADYIIIDYDTPEA